MSEVSSKLNDVLEYVRRYSENYGYSPSIREICSALGIKSTATCHYYLKKLEKSGEINKVSSKKRAISVKKDDKSVDFVSVPVIGTVTAGTPILAYENTDGYCPLPDEFGDEKELFMLKVKGTSMIEAGILDGDKVIVKKQNNAENGEIVVALIEDEATVKRFYKKENKIILHPENDALSDIILDDVTILGVVEGLLRKY